MARATAANICADEHQAETGVVPFSGDAVLELLGPSLPTSRVSMGGLHQPRDCLPAAEVLGLAGLPLCKRGKHLFIIQQVMNLFLEKKNKSSLPAWL